MATALNMVLLSLLTLQAANAVSQFRGSHDVTLGTGHLAPKAGEAKSYWTSLGVGAALGAAVASAIVFLVLRAAEPKDEKQEVVEEEVKEAEPEEEDEGTMSDDAQALLQLLAQKVAQDVGPKISKAGAIRNALEARMKSFPDKAKDLLINEMKSTAGEVLKDLDAAETMLLLDADKAVDANFPAASILAAGAMSPICMKLTSYHHLVQLVTVALPVLALCVAAIIVDWGAPCPSIPTIFGWLYTQTFLATCAVIGHGVLLIKIAVGKSKLAARAEELKEKNEDSNMRDQCVGQQLVLQEALIIENDIRGSIWNKMVGAATFAWLITTIWNLALIARYTFVPGIVAFHPKAAHLPSYCGTWMTVLVLRVNLLLAVLYFFSNLATVVKWVCDLMVDSEGFQNAVLAEAQKMDAGGLPIVEGIVKSLLLHGGNDTLNAKISKVQKQKGELTKEQAEIESKQASLQKELETVAAEEQALKDQGAGKPEETPREYDFDPNRHVDDQALKDEAARRIRRRSQIIMRDNENAAKDAVEQAESKAKEVQEQTAKAIEELMAKMSNAAKDVQSKAQAAMEQAKAAAQDPELQKKLSEAANKAMADAQAAAEQAKAAAQDPELQKKLSEAADKAMAEAQSAAEQAKAAAQDPEMEKKLAEAAQKASDKAKSAGQDIAESMGGKKSKKK